MDAGTGYSRKVRRSAAAIAADNVDDDDDDEDDEVMEDGEGDEDDVQRSLKDPTSRRSELLSRAPSSLGSTLLSSVVSDMGSYMKHGFAGTDVVFECICGGEDGILVTAATETAVKKCAEALVKHIEETSSDDTDILGEYFMSRLLKRVLIAKTPTSTSFADELFRRCIKGKAAELAKVRLPESLTSLCIWYSDASIYLCDVCSSFSQVLFVTF